jgi:ribosome-associated protein
MTEENALLQSIIEGIQEKKGKNICTIQLKGMPGAVCDYFVICEGNTPTQVSAVADSIDEMAKKKTGENPLRVHGKQLAEWVGIDYGSIIVHIFLPELRRFYNIDNLWEDARLEHIPAID